MKNFLVFLCSVFLVFGILGSAEAIPYLDVDGDHDGSVWMGEVTNPSETWVFDLVNDTLDIGNIGVNDIVDTAFTGITIDLAGPDLGDRWLEFADLSFDGTPILNNIEVDNGVYTFNVLAYFETDYILSVTIDDVHHSAGLVPANFLVDEIRVYGQYTVPEPATMLLLGCGLIGLAGLGRKKFRRK